MNIPVFLSSDDNFAPFVATTMASILLHTKEFVEFYIIDCGISQENKQKIENTKKYFKNFSTEFIYVNTQKIFKDMPELKHISVAMYGRYLIPEIKLEIDRAIYSDIDVAAVDDIKILWEEDLEGYALGAVKSQRARVTNNYSEKRKRLKLDDAHDVFSSGLLLIDCQKWRENSYTQKLLLKVEELKEVLELPDADAMNVVFNNNYKRLDPKYCVIYKILKECYTREEEEALIDRQIIVHYPGALNCKPWNNPKLRSAEYFWKAVPYTDFEQAIQKRLSKYRAMFITRLPEIVNRKIRSLAYKYIFSKIG